MIDSVICYHIKPPTFRKILGFFSTKVLSCLETVIAVIECLSHRSIRVSTCLTMLPCFTYYVTNLHFHLWQLWCITTATRDLNALYVYIPLFGKLKFVVNFLVFRDFYNMYIVNKFEIVFFSFNVKDNTVCPCLYNFRVHYYIHKCFRYLPLRMRMSP